MVIVDIRPPSARAPLRAPASSPTRRGTSAPPRFPAQWPSLINSHPPQRTWSSICGGVSRWIVNGTWVSPIYECM